MMGRGDDQVRIEYGDARPMQGVRFPAGLREALKDAASANRRSANAEIVARLAQSFDSTGDTDMAKGSAITVRLTEDMKAKLDTLTVRGPYRISITSIIERGIELAAAELEAISTKDGA